MSLASDLFAEVGYPVLTEHLGDSVVYREADSDDLTITALMGAESTVEADEETGRARHRTRSCVIATDPTAVGGGVAKPAEHATVEFGGDVYRVDHVEAMTATTARLALSRPDVRSKSSPGYRGGRR